MDFNLANSDTDGDGLDDAYDTDCAPCGSVTGVTAPIQNEDGDSLPDFRDNDDDADNIFTIDEPLDLGGAAGTPDYLETFSNSCGGAGTIQDDVSGNADVTDTETDITGSFATTGTPDDIFASFTNEDVSSLVLDLTDSIPDGEDLVFRMRSETNGRNVEITIDGSTDNMSFTTLGSNSVHNF